MGGFVFGGLRRSCRCDDLINDASLYMFELHSVDNFKGFLKAFGAFKTLKVLVTYFITDVVFLSNVRRQNRTSLGIFLTYFILVQCIRKIDLLYDYELKVSRRFRKYSD